MLRSTTNASLRHSFRSATRLADTRIGLALAVAVAALLGARVAPAQAQTPLPLVLSTCAGPIAPWSPGISIPTGRATERQIVEMTNDLRLSRGLLPLQWDDTLAELACGRSSDMIERRYFSHDIPGLGRSTLWLLTQLPEARRAGENLGMSDQPDETMAQAVFASWLVSPSHLTNLLQQDFTRIGVAVVEGLPVPGRRLVPKLTTELFAAADVPLTRLDS